MNWKSFLILASLFSFSCASYVKVVYKGGSSTNKNAVYKKTVFKKQKKILSGKKNVVKSKKTKILPSKKNIDKREKNKIQKQPSFMALPVSGKITKKFQKVPFLEGICIKTKMRTDVLCCADGLVLYSGSHLIDYDTLVIVKHDENHITVYGFLGKSFVKNGQKIKQGEKLGVTKADKLYIETRENKKPVNPTKYLHF